VKLTTERPRKLSIERTSGLTPEAFRETYLAGAGKPVIVESWKALSRWSFDVFKERYGSDQVAPSFFLSPKLIKPTTLAEYFDYLDHPQTLPGGFWIDAATLHPRPAPSPVPPTPLYLAWNVFGQHPELLDEIELSPRFVEDWVPLLPEAFRRTMDNATRYFLAGLMIGPEDAQIGLHHDFLQTHAYLAQVVGRKRCVLFSPEDSAAIYDGAVNPDEPDLEKFPGFRNATAYECVLGPGELLFIPRRWWHHVVALEKSITVNYNFFNRVNFDGFLTSLLRALPAIVEGLDHSPEARAALGIEWVSRGFDFPPSKT
jgi:hypothetical protein